MYIRSVKLKQKPKKPKAMTIKNTTTFKLVSEEARELSWKLQNTIYVIQKGNTLYTSLNSDNVNVLCAYKLGNEIKP